MIPPGADKREAERRAGIAGSLLPFRPDGWMHIEHRHPSPDASSTAMVPLATNSGTRLSGVEATPSSTRARGGEGASLLLRRDGEFVVECATTCSGHVGDASHDGRLAVEVNVAPAQAQGEHGVSGVAAAVDQRSRARGVGAGLTHHFQKIARPQPRTGPRSGDKQDLPVASPGLNHGSAGFLQGFDDAGCQAASSATSPGSGVPSSHCRKAPPAVET